jgi:poly-gamma-glutamate capsule biosynthesis protein CapA/YwtB (metallophosphatase superfamily)
MHRGGFTEGWHDESSHEAVVTLLLCGDVMTGRGIDQVLPHPSDPNLHEPYLKSALGYVELAETAHGPIPRPVDFSYVWGEAVEVLGRSAPDARIVNLETAVTVNEQGEAKGINYRMHPDNVPCLGAAGIDCCVLANNHMLDWGAAGLLETLEALHRAGIGTAGAGRDLPEAQAPAVLEVPGKGRTLVFSFGVQTSGIPEEWAATGEQAGVNFLPDLSEETVRRIAARVRALRSPGDRVLASIHWGGNWGYAIPHSHRAFARKLVDQAGVDLVHGHSSHHPLGIEVYRDKLILYGCGDFLNDYEGIEGYEEYRDDLAVAYLATLDPSNGRLVRLEMQPFQIRRFRLNRAVNEDARWLRDTLDRECRQLGSRMELTEEGTLRLRWRRGAP